MRRLAAALAAATLPPVTWAAAIACAAALLATVAAPPAAAQGTGAPGAGEAAPADVPSGPASLSGRVVHAARPEAAAGAEVVLYALSAQGQPGSRRTETGPDGRFRFEGIANDPGVVYLVGVRHEGIPFPGERVVFAPGETSREVRIAISDATADAAGVRTAESRLRVEWSGERLLVREDHRIVNEGDRVVHVPPGARAGRTAPFRTRLLPGATGFAMPLGLVPEGIERSDGMLRFWGPLYPGEQDVSFQYEIPAPEGERTVEKAFPSGAGRVVVTAREGSPVRQVDGLAPAPPDAEAEPGLRVWQGRDRPPGFRVALHLRVPETRSDPEALSLSEARFIMEVDDVQLSTREEYALEVEPGGVLLAGPGETLLRIPLPEGAEDVRFSSDATGLGLVRLEDGAIGVRGPLQPGRHAVGVAWRLRTGEDGVRFQRSFDRRLPLLRTFVADTGVAVATDRLHRRRPVRDADRTYLVYEAFELEPDRPVTFSLRALPPRGGSGRAATAAALGLGLVALAFLLAPLQRREDAEAGAEETAPDAAAEERDAVYQSIRDLDHDHETGKLSDPDWQAMRTELKARAVALLKTEKERAARPHAEGPSGAAPPDGEGEAAPACAACGATGRPGDRFCARCGRPLGAPAA